jgi:hypothetical protein
MLFMRDGSSVASPSRRWRDAFIVAFVALTLPACRPLVTRRSIGRRVAGLPGVIAICRH